MNTNNIFIFAKLQEIIVIYDLWQHLQIEVQDIFMLSLHLYILTLIYPDKINRVCNGNNT